jgi:hypothetical protein
MPGPEEPPEVKAPPGTLNSDEAKARLDPKPGWVWALQPNELWRPCEDGWPGCVD